MVSLPRLQNLVVVAEGVAVGESDRVVREYVSGVDPDCCFRVGIVFGRKRGKVSWRVGAPLGLDLYGLLLCRDLVEVECEKRGYVGLRWMVRNFEFLWDFHDVNLEGANVTFSDLKGTLEKFYQSGSVLRREVRSSVNVPLYSVVALIHGGVPLYQVIDGVWKIGERVDENNVAVKANNGLLLRVERLLQANLEASYRLFDEVSR